VTDDGGASHSTERSVTVSDASTAGTISGAVTPGFSGTALPAGSPSSPGWRLDESNLDFVPGEVIVKFKPSPSVRPLATMQVDGVGLALARTLPAVSLRLYRAPSLAKARTLALARALNAR